VVSAAEREARTTIDTPPNLGALDTGGRGGNGRPLSIGCRTCHATGVQTGLVVKAKLENGRDIHRGIVAGFMHGELECASCHEPGDKTKLRLADGSRISFGDTMRLCAQCHGPQYRDYTHGAHGGMNGAWDLSRGQRVRNHCVDCHSPHAPRYPQVQPATRPNDRGTRQQLSDHGGTR
jgi:formate-dependent nitrite reductase cytochrome c552 subunit